MSERIDTVVASDLVDSKSTTSVLETQSPEITVFDTAHVRLQRYFTRGGDGLVIIRLEGADGDPLVSLSLFGIATTGQPNIEVSTYDERTGISNRADPYPLPSVGDGRVRYLIVGESEQAVYKSADDFQKGWGVAYSPLVGNPRRRRDGKWIAEATRWVSSD